MSYQYPQQRYPHAQPATYQQLHGNGYASHAAAASRPPPYAGRVGTYGSSHVPAHAQSYSHGSAGATVAAGYMAPTASAASLKQQQAAQYEMHGHQAHTQAPKDGQTYNASYAQAYAQARPATTGHSSAPAAAPAAAPAPASSTLETELVFLIQNLCYYYKKALLEAIGQPSVLLPEDRSVFNPFARMDMLRASRTLRDACKADLVPFMRTIVEGLKRCKYPISNIKNSLVLTVVYVERVLRTNPRAVLFSPCDISRRFHTFLFCSFLMAHKWLEDEDVRNKSWARLLKAELTLNELNDMEALLFEVLQYRLHVPNSVFDFWHSRLVVDTAVGSSPSSSSSLLPASAGTDGASTFSKYSMHAAAVVKAQQAAQTGAYASSTDMEVDGGAGVSTLSSASFGLKGTVTPATSAAGSSSGSSAGSRHNYSD